MRRYPATVLTEMIGYVSSINSLSQVRHVRIHIDVTAMYVGVIM